MRPVGQTISLILLALLACVLPHSLTPAFAGETPDTRDPRTGGASIEWPASGSLSIADGDTLEFTLRLPSSLIANAPEDALPTVGVWFVESGSKKFAADTPQAGRSLAIRSARAGEWIVQVRGFVPPKDGVGREVLVRWTFTQATGAKASGEIRYPGAIAFGSKPIDVVLLMDGSWSMKDSDPKNQRVQAVRDFVATARNSAAIGRIGIVQFHNLAVALQDLTPVNESFDEAIGELRALGMTDIDAGIRRALRLFDPKNRAGGAIVLFTDGVQEPGEYLNAHLEAQKAGVVIHTMTLGVEADRKLLKRIAEETGGSYADAENHDDISAAYAAIVSRITRLRTISSTELNEANPTLHVPVDPTCASLYVVTVAEQPGMLKTDLPGGKKWASGETLNPQTFVEKPAVGEWTAGFDPSKKLAGKIPVVQVTASARTPLYPLIFRASPLPSSPVEFDANDPRLAVSLFDGADPVSDARVEARFDYVVTVGGANKSERATVPLFDDGRHSDGAAGDGIYAADIESLEFLSKNVAFVKGTLGIVVTGTRQGQPFRRELQSPFDVKRSAPPALLVNGTFDLGEKFAGETAAREIQLRVRGAGGALKATLENTPEKLTGTVRLVDVPAALKGKEKRAQKIEITLPELLPPGDYTGIAHFEMTGVESVNVPWRVKVRAVEFKSNPERVDLGGVLPGASVRTKLKVATGGGTMQLASVASPLLTNKPFDAFTLDKAGREIELEFKIPENAQADELKYELVFRDTANRERGRVPMSLRVLSVKLNIEAKLDFGTVESGDVLAHEIAMKWDGVTLPISPRVAVGPSPLKPGLSAITPKGDGWATTFSLSLPKDAPPGDTEGSINIEAGPFKTSVPWSAKIIKPALTSDAATVDFGRVFPGRSAARKIVLRLVSARPVEVDLSLAKPFAKPRVGGVVLPEAALVFNKKLTLAPGATADIPLTLTLPDDAQDGRYDGVLRLASRLGTIDIPLTVKVVNVVDVAAFHVTPTSMNFKITEGEVLPLDTLKIVSHDDEPLQIVLSIPAIPTTPLIVEPKPDDPTTPTLAPTPALPVAYLLGDAKGSQPLSTFNVTVPPRGTASVTVRPRPDARDAETGILHVDGAGEHQEVDLRVERIAAPESTVVAPEPPKLLNWIIAGIVLGLIALALLARYFVKNSGVRYVCYAAIIHLIVFSLAMPQNAIMSALPESVEISLLDAQDSLGMSLSDQQARRLDALHTGAGGGGADDARAPVLAQAALPVKQGPVDLPTPGAGPASPRPSPMNLDAARGVENPIRPAEIPEAARGSANAQPTDDKPFALDADKPVVKEKPAPAEKVSTDTPKAADVTSINDTPDTFVAPTNFAAATQTPTRAPAVQPAAPGTLARNNSSAELDRPAAPARVAIETTEPSRRSAQAADDAPLNTTGDAPLAFDNAPAAAPKVKANPQAPVDEPSRNVPVSANASGLGAPGLGTLNAPLTPLNVIAPGTPNASGSGAGDTRVALARTSAMPVADPYAGVGGGPGGATDATISGTGFGRVSGGLPAGGDEPLAIGTNGGDGPGAKASGAGPDGVGGGKGSGEGRSIIGGTQSGNGSGGFGGTGRTTAAGGGGLGGDGKDFATGGSGKGLTDFGLPNGNGNEWHGHPGGNGGKGIGGALGPGLKSAQLDSAGGGGGSGGGGIGTGGGVAGGGSNAKGGGTGGVPNGAGTGPAGRVPGGLGIGGDGPGGMGDKPIAIGPPGGGGIKPNGSGIASGGGNAGGGGGGGGYGIGRTGPAGGSSLDGSGGGSGGFGLGGLGSGVAGGNGRPRSGDGKSLSLAPGLRSKDLEDGGQKAKVAGVIPGPPHRGISSPFTGGLIRIGLGLAKHSGDWNSSPTALQHLRSAFIERSGLPELEVTVPTVDLNDIGAMMKCRVIMITSNFPVIFKPDEIAGMREYIARGGTLWVNDSSASDYEKFDEAFRPQVPLIVPGSKLEKLPVDHDYSFACYDLSKGFKGFRIPPGDKYRQDYNEAAFMPDPKKAAAAVKNPAAPNAAGEVADLDGTPLIHRRAGIIYSRNDYSDGLEIDPRMNAGMKSLTDLTNAEMLESSLRFGMNLVAYSMGGGQGLRLPPPPEAVAEFEKIYRYKGPELPMFDNFAKLTDQWNKPIWVAESKDFFNESLLDFAGHETENGVLARIACKAGTRFKAAISRFGDSDFSKTRALVFDLHSGMTQGMNVSMMFYSKDGKVYETRAVFVRPGWNRNMRFPLEMGDMKCNKSAVPWSAYDTPFEPRNAVERISVLIYNLNETGTVLVGPIREQK